MMQKYDLAGAMRDILIECKEDQVGLWSVVRYVKETGVVDNGEVAETTLHLLNELLSAGRIVAGEFRYEDDEFHRWEMNPQDIVAKIEDEWKKLGRDPTIGEIVWFVAPELI